MRQVDFFAGADLPEENNIFADGAPQITVSGNRIFSADYARDGNDLVLSNDGAPDVRIVDYFASGTPADLVSDNGAVLNGTVVARLAGPLAPGEYAQATPGISADPIGQVEQMEGRAWAERTDGTRVELSVGAKIYPNDVLITDDGSKASVTFADGTIFTLAAASRMVIDDLIYDAGADDGNSGAFSLVQGSFVFIAGEVARTGGMEVNTPTATMGIRGTTVMVEIITKDGVSTVEVSLNRDPDGGIGAIELRDLDGNLIATIDDIDSKWIVSPVEGETREVFRTAEDLADDESLLLDAARAYALAFERVDAGGTFVQLASTGSGNNTSAPDTGTPPSDEPPATGSDDTPPPGPTGSGNEGEGNPPPPTDQSSGDDQTPANSDPSATDDAASGAEDSTITGNVFANDSDADGDTLTVIVNNRPANGTLSLDNLTGDFTYTPDPDFNGTDSFTYTVSDGNGGTDSATVTVSVDPAEDTPEANDVTTTTDEDTPVTFDAGFDTADADGDPVTVKSFTQGQNGSVTSDGSGGFTYTPDPDFNGTDSFTYTVTDGNGNTDTATVSVSVSPQSDAPSAEDEDVTVNEDASVTISPYFSDPDADGDPVTILHTSAPAHGTVTDLLDGSFVYTPDPDYFGTDSFTYTVSDGTGETATANVSVTVDPVNDAPVLFDEVVELEVFDFHEGVLLATDVENDPLTYGLSVGPNNGFAHVNGDGTYTYTPDEGFTGVDTITVTVDDGNGGTDTATITFEVTDESYTSENGQTVAMGISASPEGDQPAGNVRIEVSEVQTTTINLSFALDASGSVGSAGWNQITAAVHDALDSLADQFAGSQTTVNVQIIRYGSSVTYNQTFDLLQGEAALLAAINNLNFTGGGTRWDLAINAATGFFDTNGPDATNILYFVTDGYPSNSNWVTSLSNLQDNPLFTVDVQAFGIGANFSTSDLQQLDSDGTPTPVSTPGALLAAIQESPLFAAQLVDFSLSLTSDGTDHGVIADENSPALTPDGLNYNLALAQIDGLCEILGEDNLFSATATFDLDGDLNTTLDRVTLYSNEKITVSETPVNEVGTGEHDLLLGSNLGDNIDGAGGDDLILGFGGYDIIQGGAGDDIIVTDGTGEFDGGTGRDTLKLAIQAASDLIPTLAGSDFEAITLDNQASDNLFLTATDVANLSSEADTELETLLNQALGDSATILGETGDVITLLPESGGTWQASPTTYTDQRGNTLEIYQFLQGGSVVATLGIDEDITVNVGFLA